MIQLMIVKIENHLQNDHNMEAHKERIIDNSPTKWLGLLKC